MTCSVSFEGDPPCCADAVAFIVVGFRQPGEGFAGEVCRRHLAEARACARRYSEIPLS